MHDLSQTRPLTAPVHVGRWSLARLVARLIEADARYRQKQALRGMPAERLADLGMSRGDVERAFR